MKKLIASTTVFILAILLVQAQENITFKSKVKLNDGSELRVVIIENVPGKYIKIKLPGNETAVIEYTSIVSIKHKDFVYEQSFELPKGFYYEGSLGLQFGRSNEYSARAGLALGATASYRFFPVLSLGVGIEPTMLSGFLTLPIYFRLGGDFKERRVGATYVVDAGWAFAKSTNETFATVDTDGGWFVRPGLGLRINSFVISVAYQIQKITTTSTDPVSPWVVEQVVVEERVMRNLVFGVRLAF